MTIRKKYGDKVYILKTNEIKEGGFLGTGMFSKTIYEMEIMIPEDNAPYTSSYKYEPRKYLLKRQKDEEYLRRQKEFPGQESYQPEFRREEKQPEPKDKEPDTAKERQDTQQQKTLQTGYYTGEHPFKDIEELLRSLQSFRNSLDSGVQVKNAKEKTADEGSLSLEEESKDTEKVSKNVSFSVENEKPAASFTLEAPTKEEIEALLNFEDRKYTKPVVELEKSEELLLKVREKLSHFQFSPDFMQKFFQVLKMKLPSARERNPREFYEFVISEIKKFFYYEPGIKIKDGETNLIFFVGPNGSGKTTSLAKIAAKFKYEYEELYSIGIISLDDYRIAATEQLRSYSHILQIPFYAPIHVSDFKEILTRESLDVIFVDTAGLSFKDGDRLAKIKSYIDAVKTKEVHLVLSATMRFDILEKYIAFFQSLPFDKIILTGLDEINFSGYFIELSDKIKRPYSYFMNGQDVPDDVMELKVEEILENVFK